MPKLRSPEMQYGYDSTEEFCVYVNEARFYSLQNNVSERQIRPTETKKNLLKSKDIYKKEIHAFRKELDDYIDQLEQNMLKELDELETKEKSSIDQKITTLVTALQRC